MTFRMNVLHRMTLTICASLLGHASVSAQTVSPFLFTVTAPDTSLHVGESQPTVAMAERGLTLSTGSAFDPGLSIEARVKHDLIVRSTVSTSDLRVGGQSFATFQQVELLRPVRQSHALEIAVGGGVRQEWGGTRTLIARIVAGAPMAGGRLEGNVVMEKAMALGRDRADVITTVGWSRAVTRRFALGVEGIGQDLEGFWEPDEAEGGARLLIGPSLHVGSKSGRWSLTVTGGPLARSASSARPSDAPRGVPGSSALSRYAALGSFTYIPWLHR
jgi:hypothetical protein